MGRDRSKMAQVMPKMVRERNKIAQDRPKIFQDSSKTDPRWPNTALRWLQEGPGMFPRGAEGGAERREAGERRKGRTRGEGDASRPPPSPGSRGPTAPWADKMAIFLKNPKMANRQDSRQVVEKEGNDPPW